MAINPPKEHQVKEGPRTLRRGEGAFWTLDKAQWGSATVTSSAVASIIRQSDESDVIADFIAVNSTSESTTFITLPEIVAPAAAALGDYICNISFEDGTWSPGIPWMKIVVTD